MNGQANPVYGLNPFQRVEIDIGSLKDRSNGDYLAQFEGSGFYVERCDYPVLMAMNSQAGGGLSSAIPLREGMEFTGLNFKGFVLTHPALQLPGKLTLILFHGDAAFTNQFSDPISRGPLSWRNIGFGAAGGTTAIYVPPGVRGIANLQYTVIATSITSNAQLTFYDINGNQINSSNNLTQNIGGATVTYDNGGAQVIIQAIANLSNGYGIANFQTVYVPALCAEMRILINGTVMSTPVVTGNWR